MSEFVYVKGRGSKGKKNEQKIESAESEVKKDGLLYQPDLSWSCGRRPREPDTE